MKIKDVIGREILDSRGWPTVEVDIILDDGTVSRASVPSGASTGKKEALELRDYSNEYLGRGVKKAVNNVNTILKDNLIGMNVLEQEKIDKKMLFLDGTENKSKIGANAILGCSLAICKAKANYKKIPLYKCFGNEYKLPIPMFNIINGGKHSNNNLDIQEFMIVPINRNIKEGLRICSEVFHILKKELELKEISTNVGDEGGFAPMLSNTKEALELIIESIKKAGYIPGKDIALALDVAANELYEEGFYYFENQKLNTDELLQRYIDLVEEFPIISIEDPFYEEDYKGFEKITEILGKRIQIVGDDLFVTNPKYLKKGIECNLANTIIIKMNQIGTITEMLETIKLAKDNNYRIIISHRSGETEDTSISDFAVGLCLEKIKAGSLSRGERICKYNRLLRIEEEILKKS